MPAPMSLLNARCLYGLTLLAAIGGCSSHPADNATAADTATAAATATFNAISYPAVDAELGEQLYPGEQAMAREMALVIAASLRKQYATGTLRRDAHPKAHGCVRAEFQVRETLPERLATGVFVPGKTWQAWLRFSSGSRDASRPDFKKDAHGLAIKLLGVPGKKLLEDEAEAGTQDFILIDHPVFFANDPERYLALLRDQNRGLRGKLHMPFALGARGTLIALKTASKRIASPLQTRYWSMVPYQLGRGPARQAVKYSVRSCSAPTETMPKKPGPDYLRAALRTTLQRGDACLAFLVQPRSSDAMKVEDAMTEWPESRAPFFQVATIRIPAQVFDTPEQNSFCENLAFTPWHALPEHRPLGVMNRLRKVIYDHISRLRHEQDPAGRQEPGA